MHIEKVLSRVESLSAAEFATLRSETWVQNEPLWRRSVREDRFRQAVFDAVIARIGAEVGQPQTLIDFGCGDGAFLHQAAAVFPKARLRGVDSCKAFVDGNDSAAGRIAYELNDIEAGAPWESADVGVCILSLFEMNYPVRALSHIGGALKQNGRVFCVILDSSVELMRLFRFKMRESSTRLLEVEGEFVVGSHFYMGQERSPQPYFRFIRPMDLYLRAGLEGGLAITDAASVGAGGMTTEDNVPRAVLLTFERSG